MMGHEPVPAPLAPSPAPRTRRRWMPLVGIALTALTLVGGGYYALRANIRACDFPEEQELPPSAQAGNGFANWQKPLMAIVVSGQMHGYIDPCGCSYPQYGGLVRRYNFIDSLKAKGWDVVGIDLGDLAPEQGIQAQKLLKFDLTMKSLATMSYRAIGIGELELKQPLGEALAQTWEKNRPFPRPVSLTIKDPALDQLNLRPYEVVALGNKAPKLGVISMIGPDMRNQFKQEKFGNNGEELPKALNTFAKEGVEITMLLHHEDPKVAENLQGFQRLIAIEKARKEMASKCAQVCDDLHQKNKKIPPVHLMMVLTDEPEPPALMSRPDPKLPTQVIEIGHKGIYVGLIGVYRDRDGSFRFEYQIVKMGPEFETPEAKKAAHPVIQHMERYNLQLKQANMLDRFPRSPHFNQVPLPNKEGLRAKYIGSDRCADCHAHAFATWQKTPHGHATETLEKLKHPSNRNWDPECMMCHTTGFKHPGGYNDPIDLANWPPAAGQRPDAKALAKHNNGTKPDHVGLRGVGCESCHGPGSEHVKNPNNAALYPLINPYRPSNEERALEDQLAKNPTDAKAKATHDPLFRKRMEHLSRFCTSCHDAENDVNWGKAGQDVVAKWIGKGIIHRTPAANPPAAPKAEPEKKVQAPRPKDVDELLYTLLRKDGCIKHPKINMELYVDGVQDRKLRNVVLMRKAADGKAFDFIARAKEADLRYEPDTDRILIQMHQCQVVQDQQGNGFNGIAEKHICSIELPADMTWLESLK
jgi:hypothetical protein